MPELLRASDAAGIKRTRKRIDSLKVDKKNIADRIHKFYTDDTTDRSEDIENRIQRYAKLRMWREGKDWPWEDASDSGLADLMTHSLRIQDTLHNAVMSTRPAVVTHALNGKQDLDKQEKIDNLIDFQVFVETAGEKFIGECADAYVNDGVYNVFTAWVREDREVVDIRFFPAIPDETLPVQYFTQIVQAEFPKAEITRLNDGWDWKIDDEDAKPIKAAFYTRDDGKVELLMRRTVRIFDGPKPRVMHYEDVLYPSRADNLQIPGPSNPGGAAHVILLDYPTVDEIRRHHKSKFYDLMSKEDMNAIEKASLDRSRNQTPKQQRDRMQGTTEPRTPEVVSHRPLTRVLCFDMYDIDGDGIDEDVVWWMILETKTVVKAKYLTEMWPGIPPYRPLAGTPFIPIRGRVSGIGIPELLEASHDIMKQVFDQTIDAGTLANAPFGFYKATSNMKPEVIRAWPGELYPLGDPQRDVYFPTFSQTAQSFGINVMTIVGQQQDKLALQGDLQFGRIPAGQSSALRSAKSQQTVLAQGEARPERILRRFFMGLCQVWFQIHQLNQRFLPEKKKFMVVGFMNPEDDPYVEIKDTKEIEGNFQFDFRANILNASKEALQSAMQQLLSVYMNPVMFQLGIVTQDNVYQMARDYGKSLGQDPDGKYLTAPQSNEPLILFEEAIDSILHTEPPKGRPAEGAQAHLQKLVEFGKSDNLGLIQTPVQLELFKAYFMKIRNLAVQEMQMQRMAQMMQQGQGSGQNSQDQSAVDLSNPMLMNNELIDETLPSAR